MSKNRKVKKRKQSLGITSEWQHRQVDKIASHFSKFPSVETPLKHRFTPGLYCREIFMRKGTSVVSKIHRKEHPFIIISGRAAVWDAENGVQQLRAGHVGITKPGTRRILFIHEDCRWITFHVTDKTDLAEIEAEVIEPREIKEAAIDDSILEKLKQLTEGSI